MVPLESATSLFLSGNFAALLVVLPRVPLIPQKLGIHSFGCCGGAFGFLDAILRAFVGSCFLHLSEDTTTLLVTQHPIATATIHPVTLIVASEPNDVICSLGLNTFFSKI